MTKLKIIVGEDNRVLRAGGQPVKKFDGKLKKLAKQMRETMIDAKGLGLAAPQVGENLRMVVVVLNYDTPHEITLTMVNPKILAWGKEKIVAEEGCLSLPGQYSPIERYAKIKVEFFDLGGTKQVLDLSDLNARVIQHEIDHLDGVLFVDRVENLECSEKGIW
jgi:peptide deformylase